MKIGAIIIAYNNPLDLSRLLDSILQSTLKPTKLYIIDNSDTDIIFQNKQIINEKGIDHYYVANNKNLGSAGGYAIGMKVAYNEGMDWLWLLDQDGTIHPQCLSTLLMNADRGEILSPLVLSLDCSRIIKFTFKENLFGNVIPVNKDVSNVVRAGSHGLFISNKVVKNIGVYDSQNYFVGYEDHDYCLRAIRHGYKIVYVSNAIVYHPDLGKKYSLIKQNTFREKIDSIRNVFNIIIPPFFGYAKYGDSLARSEFSAYSYAYLMAKYYNYFQVIFAYINSLMWLLVRKLIKPELVAFWKTVHAYRKGIRNGLKDRKVIGR